MQYDLRHEEALPTTPRSACPCCYSPLIAKCGSIKIWHWAHESGFDCDAWYEPISDWHLDWQRCVAPKYREVVMGEHRADIRLSSGRVIEIQHSAISVEEVEERETFYNNMTWIFDAEAFKENLLLKRKVGQQSGRTYYTFHWKRPRRSILACKTFPVYFDFQDGTVFEVKKFTGYDHEGDWGQYTSWGGWGYLLAKSEPFYVYLFACDYVQPSPALIQPAS